MNIDIFDHLIQFRMLHPEHENIILDVYHGNNIDNEYYVPINRLLWGWDNFKSNYEHLNPSLGLAHYIVTRREEMMDQCGFDEPIWSDETLRNICRSISKEYDPYDRSTCPNCGYNFVHDEPPSFYCSDYKIEYGYMPLSVVERMNRKSMLQYIYWDDIKICEECDPRLDRPAASLLSNFITEDNYNWIDESDYYKLYDLHIDEAIEIQDELLTDLLNHNIYIKHVEV